MTDTKLEPELPQATIYVSGEFGKPMICRPTTDTGGVMLKLGTLKCPDDKENLWFELFQGIRVVREVGGVRQYSAKCPKCHKYYSVKAPKDQGSTT